MRKLFTTELTSDELREIADEHGADYENTFFYGPRVVFWNDRKVADAHAKVKLYKSGTFTLKGEFYPEEIDFLIKTLKILKKELVS